MGDKETEIPDAPTRRFLATTWDIIKDISASDGFTKENLPRLFSLLFFIQEYSQINADRYPLCTDFLKSLMITLSSIAPVPDETMIEWTQRISLLGQEHFLTQLSENDITRERYEEAAQEL